MKSISMIALGIAAVSVMFTATSAQYLGEFIGGANTYLRTNTFASNTRASTDNWFGNEAPKAHVTVRPQRTQPRFAAKGPAYCVRTCDGFFFPVNASGDNGSSATAPQKVCESLCPGAQVTTFRSDGSGNIETATGAKGQKYSKLANAFRFRQGVVPSCSCQRNPADGLAHLSIMNDSTLRRGDVLVTDKGARLFKGSSTFPYSETDFVSVRSHASLPADMRHRLGQIDARASIASQSQRREVAQRARLAAKQQQNETAKPAATPKPIRVIELTRREGGLTGVN